LTRGAALCSALAVIDAEAKTPFAWEPLTPRGVAAFAEASLRRLWLVQLLVAIFAAAVVLWLLLSTWFPVIQQAVRQLPAQGYVRGGRLVWQGPASATLAENHFLALTVDLSHAGSVRSPAHLQVEFGERDVVFLSLFGVVQTPYPRGYIIAFNRNELEPWWGAWKPVLLAVTPVAVVSGLMVSWGLLALLYCPMAWLTAFFANRNLTLGGSYRLSGAALLPGALFMMVALVLYGLGALDVLRLLIMAGVHLLIGWVYLFWAPFWRPLLPGQLPLTGNPFRPQKNRAGTKDPA